MNSVQFVKTCWAYWELTKAFKEVPLSATLIVYLMDRNGKQVVFDKESVLVLISPDLTEDYMVKVTDVLGGSNKNFTVLACSFGYDSETLDLTAIRKKVVEIRDKICAPDAFVYIHTIFAPCYSKAF